MLVNRFEDNAMDLVKDLSIKIAWDSIQYKGIYIDKEGLVDRAISHGIYIFVVKDMLIMRFRQNIETEAIVTFLAGLVGKSVLDVVAKMIRKQQFSYQEILISNAIGEGLGAAWVMISGFVEAPSNGVARPQML